MDTVHIFFDCDSTLTRIEGIDELARVKGLHREVSAITHDAMEGRIAFEDAFARRLDLLRPNQDEIGRLGQLYIENICEGVEEAVHICLERGFRVSIVSGGFRDPILSLAAHLGIEEGSVFANVVLFDRDGNYTGFDSAAPTAREHGKSEIVQSFGGRKYMIGDGISDLQTKPFVHVFAAFTGVVHRPGVVSGADVELKTFLNFENFMAWADTYYRKEANYAIL